MNAMVFTPQSGHSLESSLRYNPALDGLRAVAIALVIADHCHVPGFDGGYFGVDLFFVLSGFLITRLLVDEFDAAGQIDLPRFYLRRLLRLAPPLLLLLAAYLVIAPMIWPQYGLWSHIRDAALAGFYLSDYGRAFWHYPIALQHTWSLSVEEHFYLIWPFAVLLLARIELRWRIAGLFGIYLIATAWRIFEYESSGWVATYFRFDTRMSGLICGALLAICLPRMGRISENDRQRCWRFRVRRARCLPLARLLAFTVDFGVDDESGPDGRRGFVDLGLVTKLMGELDVVGAAPCWHWHHLLRHVSVALSRGRLLQRSASLVPDRPDRSDFCASPRRRPAT